MELLDLLLNYGDNGLTVIVLGYMVYKNGKMLDRMYQHCLEMMFKIRLDEQDTTREKRPN